MNELNLFKSRGEAFFFLPMALENSVSKMLSSCSEVQTSLEPNSVHLLMLLFTGYSWRAEIVLNIQLLIKRKALKGILPNSAGKES